MAADPKLVVALEARLNRFEKQLKEAGVIADREVRRIEDRFERANPSFGAAFTRGILGAAAAAFSLERAFAAVLNTVQSTAKIGDVAERVGLSAEQLQELRYALQLSGGEAEQANVAMERFATNLSKAASGGGNLARFLQDNGVALRDQRGQLRSTADLLAEVANLIQNAATPQERLNIATAFFGRTAGPAMAKTLSEGSAGLARIAQDGRDAGAIIRDDLVKAAQELDDKWDKLVATLTAKSKSAILENIDSIQRYLTAIDEWASKVLPILQAINRFNPVQILGETFGPDLSGPGMASGPSPLKVTVNKGGTTNTRSLGAGGAGRRDAFEREEDRIQKRIALMNAEAEAVGRGTYAREFLRTEAELMQAVEQAQIPITEDLIGKVGDLADQYAQAAEKAEQARDKIQAINDVSREFGNAFADAFKDAAIEGKKLDEVLRGLLNRLSSKGIDYAFGLLFDAPRGGGVSPFGSLISGLVGRASGGPVAAGMPYMVGERGRELFVPKAPGMIVPNSVVRGMGGTNVSITMANDFRGADPSMRGWIEGRMQVLKREVQASIVPTVLDARRRSVRV